MINAAAVFLGGGLGSLCRYGIARGLAPYKFVFPYATVAANVIACFILGFMINYALKPEVPVAQKLFFMVGFCGGFSTFSTFTSETLELLQGGYYGLVFWNVAGSLVICLIALYLGLLAGKMLVN